ncbi:MAG TPA: addiction module toxin RelE [Vicinamibacteria bacterium]|nr:addiction module toxin RelE [Vicinamibacteria bacterium]
MIEDLRWFGKKDGRLLLKEIEQKLSLDPLADTRNMKTLRKNPVAQRELRPLGKYRVLFNVREEREEVTIILVGEKRGDSLLVRGEEFAEHHESDSIE